MKKILLIGPPGAGKTVLATKLSEIYGVPFIKTGSLLRDLKPDNKYYQIVNNAMKQGVLAPNTITGKIVEEEVNKFPSGYVLDGWMRQLIDADVFEPEIDVALYLNCPKEVCKDRILNRVICKIHDIYYSFSEDVCTLCGGVMEKRSDDSEDTFQKRWGIYENLTYPVLGFYKDKGLLKEVDVNRDIPSILEDIDYILKNLWLQQKVKKKYK